MVLVYASNWATIITIHFRPFFFFFNHLRIRFQLAVIVHFFQIQSPPQPLGSDLSILCLNDLPILDFTYKC